MRKRSAAIGVVLLTAAAAIVAKNHEVPTRPTMVDEIGVRELLGGSNITDRELRDFREELKLVLLVQHKVLQRAPTNKGIPNGQPREINDLLSAGYGLCYDRSRAIETALRLAGMKVRHVAVYSTHGTRSSFRSLVKPGVMSHALTEVKTQRGWMLVDSNHAWIGLTRNWEPVSIAALHSNARQSWSKVNRAPIPPIFRKDFTWVYGLYSRHGRFYSPYNAVPDVNWAELLQNF